MRGSSAMSPSMLKTPSVMTSLTSASATSASAASSPAMSLWLNTLRSARESRAASMMLA